MKTHRLLIICCLIACLAFSGCGTILFRATHTPDGSVVAWGGPDDVFMMQGIDHAKTFTDTLKWWHGPWAFYPGNNYYRPIPSLLFWLELHWTGWHALKEVSYLHVAWHICCAILLFCFLRYLFTESLAFIATALWCISVPERLSLVGAKWTLVDWINGTDVWMSIAMILTMWSYTAYLRQNRRVWLTWTCIASAVAICCKEIGYFTLPMLAAILWYEDCLRDRWRSLLYPSLTASTLLVVRYLSVHGLPGHNGSGNNGSWIYRAAMDLFGVALPTMTGDLLPLAIASAGCALILLCFDRKRESVATAGAALLFIALTPILNHETFYNVFLRAIGSEVPWSFAILIGAQWLLLRRYLTVREKAATLGIMWATILYAVGFFALFYHYGLYLQSVGWAIFLAVPLDRLLHSMPSRTRRDADSARLELAPTTP